MDETEIINFGVFLVDSSTQDMRDLLLRETGQILNGIINHDSEGLAAHLMKARLLNRMLSTRLQMEPEVRKLEHAVLAEARTYAALLQKGGNENG